MNTQSFLNRLINSLDNHTKSFSLRKLFALLILIFCYIVGRYYFMIMVSNPYYLLLGLVLDAVVILLLIGLITFQQIIELKKDLPDSNNLINKEENSNVENTNS